MQAHEPENISPKTKPFSPQDENAYRGGGPELSKAKAPVERGDSRGRAVRAGFLAGQMVREEDQQLKRRIQDVGRWGAWIGVELVDSWLVAGQVIYFFPSLLGKTISQRTNNSGKVSSHQPDTVAFVWKFGKKRGRRNLNFIPKAL